MKSRNAKTKQNKGRQSKQNGGTRCSWLPTDSLGVAACQSDVAGTRKRSADRLMETTRFCTAGDGEESLLIWDGFVRYSKTRISVNNKINGAQQTLPPAGAHRQVALGQVTRCAALTHVISSKDFLSCTLQLLSILSMKSAALWIPVVSKVE